MKTPLTFAGFLMLTAVFGVAQPYGLSNRVANTTLQFPTTLPTTHAALMNAINYFIPADNPFVGATQFNGASINTNALRAEFWAVGMRNPWRMFFDRVTGTLYVGDVGGSLREEINVVLRGSNYGWAYREGTINGPKAAQAPAGFTSMPPITEYAHGSATNQGNSVTGGVMYRGNRVPAIDGKYVYCDYVSGNVWALTPNGTNTVPFTYLTNDANITAFGIDPVNGDVLMADIVASQIKRLVSVPGGSGVGISNAFPGVTFNAPICIASPPGETNRLFILERAGLVTVITNLAVPNRTVFMDISSRVITGGEEGLLGIAFHPNYAANRYFYLFYSLNTNTAQGTGRHQRVARFETSSLNPNIGVPSSELPLITQSDDYSNHNGGDLHFGPDGYLYISLGDEGNQNDLGNNSQRIDKDFFSGILRIDVDKRPGNLPPLNGPNPPATLDQTGAFSDLVNLTPHPGIVEYDVNVPQWADNAIIRHWFSIPNVSSRMAFRPTANWTLQNTIWIQHFELETIKGDPSSRRRIETRFLVRDGSGGAYGVTYRWTSATNATLVPSEGASETFVISDGGIFRDQVWNYPAQSECIRCHSASANRALAFNTPQLNRDFNYNDIVDNQLRALHFAGYFAPPPQIQPTNIHLLLALAPLADEAYSLEYRSRSYLMANCAQCHIAGAATNGTWEARLYGAISLANIINGPLNNNRGDAANRVVVPNDPAHSMLLTFLSTVGGGHTQSFRTTLIDTQAVSVITRWIEDELPGYRTFAQWQVLHFGSTGVPEAAATADPDNDRARNMLEYLTGTNPTNSATPDGWSISAERTTEGVDIAFERIANRFFEVQWAPNLNSNSVWRALNVPQNRPFAAISNSTWRVPDATTNGPARFYRARVYEP